MRAQWRKSTYFSKYRQESIVIFREWTFFTKCGHERRDFFVKNRKKGFMLSFMTLNIL